ncbi:MAG: ribosome recycling factor [Candidatus Krumholzibacteriia bacterium]|nr:ribosome recycling factor [bacterium]MCB9512855.1 ribosome recycling factor [Candidatus Latescibacterota bacterium]MCB9516939.1 ribosome recycling factor [Candidatus Latescibacterota bacterium]
MNDPLLTDVEDRMSKTVRSTEHEFTQIRAGRASTGLLDSIRVDYYGTPTPLNQVATLAVPEARLITISPWEKSMLAVIEKAILAANIGLTPNNDGNVLRINIPALTEERRKELVKRVKQLAEEGRVAVRNVRRSGIEQAKQEQKDQAMTEDDLKRVSDEIQKLTDRFVGEIDQSLEKKITEIMEV